MTYQKPAHPRLRGWCVFILFAFATSPLRAQVSENPAGTRPVADGLEFTESAAEFLFKEIPQGLIKDAPEWVKPGTRISFWCGSKRQKSEAEAVRLDLHANGEWTNLRSGERYQEQEAVIGGTGVGFLHIDVMAVDEKYVLMEARNYLHDGTITDPIRHSTKSIVSRPAYGMYWVHPKILENWKDYVIEGAQVFATTIKVEDEERSVLRFESEDGEIKAAHIYDREEGTLLGISWTNLSKMQSANYLDEADGMFHDRTMTEWVFFKQRFLARRSLSLPWNEQRPPSYLDDMKSFEFEGSMHAGPPDVKTMSFKVAGLSTIICRGDDWIQTSDHYNLHSNIRAISDREFSETRISAAAQIGGIWMSPQVLAKLKAGQILDQDPITKVRVEVANPRSVEEVAPTVTIRELGANDTYEWVYHLETGLLIEHRNVSRVPLTDILTETEVRMKRRP